MAESNGFDQYKKLFLDKFEAHEKQIEKLQTKQEEQGNNVIEIKASVSQMTNNLERMEGNLDRQFNNLFKETKEIKDNMVSKDNCKYNHENINTHIGEIEDKIEKIEISQKEGCIEKLITKTSKPLKYILLILSVVGTIGLGTCSIHFANKQGEITIQKELHQLEQLLKKKLEKNAQ